MNNIIEQINSLSHAISRHSISLMEVCGTHTMAIWRHGLRSMLPEKIRLISGPGCPVCVTSPGQIDAAIALARKPNTIVATFGDMVRVPGSRSSLERERAAGADVRVVYSPLGALELAQAYPSKQVVFIAVGFETTAPLTASLALQAQRQGVKNLFIFCAHKLIPPAMTALLSSGQIDVDGFLCPGHVSTIIGSHAYQCIAENYGKPCVIAGFEAADILVSIKMLLQQVAEGRNEVEIQYTRCVRPEGNAKARQCVEEVLMPTDCTWRGLGVIPKSGLRLRPKFSWLDAEAHYEIKIQEGEEPAGCSCGAVLRGVLTPTECPLFATTCTPEMPVGPCMVSSEGACAAYYKYGR